MKIALVQAGAGDSLTASLEILNRYTEAAAGEGCQVICFPECFLTGYAPEEAAAKGISKDAKALEQVSQMAECCAVDILAGFMEKDDTACYITQGLFRQDGTRDHYRKTHLGQREQKFFSPGQELKVLSLTDGTRIGLQICVETHYPQITQTLALRGAEVVFAPHAVPRVSGDRQTVWGKYIPARSYDNRVYMACCNLWDTRHGGGCFVTGPRGEEIAACFREEAALLTCELDLELIRSFRSPQQTRSRHFFPALRRRELYE